jgi:uncharacterized protein YoxC
MSPMLIVTLDTVVIIALLVAIYYMRVVSGGLKTIREGRTELQQVIKEMTLSIHKADQTIQGMKNLADDKSRHLQKHMDQAEALIEELKFITQSADHVAQRLVKNTENTTPKAPAPKPTERAAPVSKAEKDLADALKRHKTGQL